MKLQSKKAPRLGVLLLVLLMLATLIPSVFAADAPAETSAPEETMVALGEAPEAAAISPLSTGGAIIMSSYSASKETTNEELNKIFKFLFLLSVGNVLLNVLLSWIGVFRLGGLF